MMEEWYDGDHPSLNYIWNWRPAPNGWWMEDIENYLEEHVGDGGVPFFVEHNKESDSRTDAIQYCKDLLQNWPATIRIEGHSGVPHFVVMKGWYEYTSWWWTEKWFRINNPSMEGSSYSLWYKPVDRQIGQYPNDRNFKHDAWKWDGYGVDVVW